MSIERLSFFLAEVLSSSSSSCIIHRWREFLFSMLPSLRGSLCSTTQRLMYKEVCTGLSRRSLEEVLYREDVKVYRGLSLDFSSIKCRCIAVLLDVYLTVFTWVICHMCQCTLCSHFRNLTFVLFRVVIPVHSPCLFSYKKKVHRRVLRSICKMNKKLFATNKERNCCVN